MDRFKILEITKPGMRFLKPFQVYVLRYVYADGTPQYKLLRQFRRLEEAQTFINAQVQA